MAQATRVRKRSTTSTPRRKTAGRASPRKKSTARVKLPTVPVEAVTRIQQGLREGISITLLALAVYLMASLVSYSASDPGWSHTGTHTAVQNVGGRGGAWFADITLYALGFASYVLPFLAAYGAWLMFRNRRKDAGSQFHFTLVRWTGAILLVSSACGLATIHGSGDQSLLPLGATGGGVVGTWLSVKLLPVLKPLGATLLLISVFMMSFTLTTGLSWFWVLDAVGGWTLKGSEWLGRHVVAFGEVISQWWVDQRDGIREAREEAAVAREVELEEEDRLAAIAAKATKKPAKAAALAAPAKAEKAAKPPRLSRAEKKAQAVAAAEERAAEFAAKAPSEPSVPSFDDATLADLTTEFTPDELPPIIVPEPADNSSFELPKEDAADAAFQAASDEDGPIIGQKAGPIVPSKRSTKERQGRLFGGQDNELPPLNLLDEPKQQDGGYSEEVLASMSRLLEEKFASYGVQIKVVAVHPGPVITRFELQLASGVKSSQITNLGKDIARSLSVLSVRVVEVVPGKTTVGIEVPNAQRETVQLSEILQSDTYESQESPLTIALGKDIAGRPYTTDLARMPHLLVAGTTGSGKSVAINVMLLSLLYKASAKDLRLILVDPKMLELNMYEGIPHLLTPVVTDMKEAANGLRWSVAEMERRYKVMAGLGVRNITGYNKKIKDAEARGETIPDPTWKLDETGLDPTTEAPALEKFPYIVIVIDEFADMIMVVGKQVEELITRIAQKARAAGIHLVLATQRPSVDVITGLIKANIPGRIAFRVSSGLNSRTILDQSGAEALLGYGDMLIMPPGSSSLERVHCAFVDDHEVNDVCEYLKTNFGSDYYEEILQESIALPGLPSEGGSGDDSESDALYDQAVAIVCETRKASISYVQRRLKIGYNRSARMIEDMELAGVVSPVGTNGQREVLAPPPVKG